MKSKSIRIIPTVSMVRQVRTAGSVVVCKSGGWPGYRIHWQPPQPGADNSETSEPLVNGEAYVCPTGSFRDFWITTESVIAHAVTPQHIDLRVIDVAAPVVVLNPRKFDGARSEVVWTQNIALLAHPGTATPYSQNLQPTTSDLYNQANGGVGCAIPRGFIVGGISAAVGYIARLWGRADASDTYWYLIQQFTVATADAAGRYSCAFDTSGDLGPLLLGWPPYGLRLTIQTSGVNVTDCQILLASRAGTG